MNLGHVHLKVSNLDEALDFSRTVLGFSISERHEGFVFLSGGSTHPVVALQK